MEKIASAVIGCGRMGAFTSEVVKRYSPACWMPLSHIEALLASPEIDLVGICDADRARLNEARTAYGIAAGFEDYHDLLNSNYLDLLTVATRTAERADIIASAVERGVKALHIEKPLCNSVAQLAQLEAILSDSGTYCTYGTLRRHLRPYQHARELVASGQFGNLDVIQINMGKGHLLWTHPHSVDLILYFAGEQKNPLGLWQS